MATYLILGGYGATGKLLAKHLLAETQDKIIVAGRHLDKAQVLVDNFKSGRVTAVRVDAADAESLRAALQGVDLLLVAAPTTHHIETVVRAALDARVDYLDVQFSSQKIAVLNKYADEIRSKNLCFVTEAGYHPGLPSAMVRYAAAQMDSIESALTAGYLSVGNLPYTEAVDELMEGFITYSTDVFREGKWAKPANWGIRKFDFGPQIGRRDCYAMFFEELRDLPEMYPTLKETGFYISGSNWIADMLVTPIVMLGLKLAPRRGLRPLGKLTWWAMQLSKPPYRVVLKVEARGSLNGRQVRVEARIEHEDGYELTAIPVVAFLLQYNQIRQPGLHMMGHLAEPKLLFQDMERMGVKVTTTIQ